MVGMKVVKVSWKLADVSARTPWRAATLVVAIVMFAGVTLGCARDGSGSAGRSTGPLADQSELTSGAPPPHVTDRYDRQVLSFRPMLYLTLGDASSGIEPDLSGNGNNGSYEPNGARPNLTTLPNGDPATTFNGVNQYVQVLSSRSLSVTD